MVIPMGYPYCCCETRPPSPRCGRSTSPASLKIFSARCQRPARPALGPFGSLEGSSCPSSLSLYYLYIHILFVKLCIYIYIYTYVFDLYIGNHMYIVHLNGSVDEAEQIPDLPWPVACKTSASQPLWSPGSSLSRRCTCRSPARVACSVLQVVCMHI